MFKDFHPNWICSGGGVRGQAAKIVLSRCKMLID